MGGVGSAMAQLVAGIRHQQGLFQMISMLGCFSGKYGRQEDLIKHCGLGVDVL
jgi:hypothetical protein